MEARWILAAILAVVVLLVVVFTLVGEWRRRRVCNALSRLNRDWREFEANERRLAGR